MCQFLHVVQAHGFQMLQQWWCEPPMLHLIIMVEAVGKQVGYTSTTSIVSPNKTCKYEIMDRYH
jgi:hypothetical protein